MPCTREWSPVRPRVSMLRSKIFCRSRPRRGQTPLFLILDGVEDPRNLGAILRTADAAGVHGVIIPERRAAGLTETVAKAAAGALEYVPVVKVVNIVNTIEDLKKAGSGSLRPRQTVTCSTGTLTLCVLPRSCWEERIKASAAWSGSTVIIRFPCRLWGRSSSLNVSVAAGVLLYEVLRQRKKIGCLLQ